MKNYRGKFRGAFWSDYLAGTYHFKDSQAQGKSGEWHIARPIPFYSLFIRLRQAWDVLRYKADALYWNIDFD